MLEFVEFEDKADPITTNKPLSECLVAGKSFRDWQTTSFENIDLSEKLYIRSTSWVSGKDVPKLLKDRKITCSSGEVLASFDPDELFQSLSSDKQSSSFEVFFAWDLLKLNEQLISVLTETEINGEMSERSEIHGHAIIGEGTRILPGVFIEGNVIIGENCKIGPNCYIRGNTSIGDNCHIGQSVEVKNCVIMNKTNIGHLSYVGDSVLGNNVNFGAGTTTSNLRHDNGNHRSMIDGELVDTGRRKFGVVIGDGVHTGINTSFYPGRKLWPKVDTLPAAVVVKDITA
ncbi:MAG: hypothetical protein NE334_03780 [Lentisphaeraceae bacterium]|nr:hypothetical protein [Lentisphaeraceae bacterium]